MLKPPAHHMLDMVSYQTGVTLTHPSIQRNIGGKAATYRYRSVQKIQAEPFISITGLQNLPIGSSRGGQNCKQGSDPHKVIYRRLINQLIHDEGFDPNPYLDVLGRNAVWTIGYGTTWILGKRVTANTPAISRRTAFNLLASGAFNACMGAQAVISNFNELCDVRQETLCNMVYNLGASGLSGFKKMIKAVELRDFSTAGLEMVDSNWHEQVGNRALRLEYRMATGIHE